MAAAIVEERARQGVSAGMLTRLGLSIFFTMNVMAFTMALWTTDVYGPTEPTDQLAATLARPVPLPGPALLAAGPCSCWVCPLFEHAWRSLRRGVVSTDWLLASGVARAFAARSSRSSEATDRSTSRSAASSW